MATISFLSRPFRHWTTSLPSTTARHAAPPPPLGLATISFLSRPFRHWTTSLPSTTARHAAPPHPLGLASNICSIWVSDGLTDSTNVITQMALSQITIYSNYVIMLL